MRIVTAAMMKKIDNYCIEELKIPNLILIENAALKLFKNIGTKKYSYYMIVCGFGNNGGDGLALARHLFLSGKRVKVFLIGNSLKSRDFSINYNILNALGIKVKNICNLDDISDFREDLLRSDIVIDAILGTGISRDITGIHNQIISIINENSKYTVSVDIPSGMNSDTGEIMGGCIIADETISFQAYKKGFIKYSAENYTGKIVVEEVGIPDFVVEKFYENENIIDLDTVRQNFISRPKHVHKGDNGRVSIIAGSTECVGAAYISAESAVKTGAGLVTLCCRKDVQPILSAKLVEAMTISIENDKFTQILKKSDAIAFGPGMGNNKDTFNVLERVLNDANCPIVLDADGLNVLKNNLSVLKNYRNDIIITPHLGELSRLTSLSIDYIKKNRIEVAKAFAKENNLIVLIKGYHTVITDGNHTIINSTGNSAMANGGMGDCLTGIIAALIGQGYEPFMATYIGAYVHGLAGDSLAKEMFSVNAESLINRLPYVLRDIENYKSN